MTDLERFLRLATWSLWGAQKRTVRLELESHIAHKTWKYQVRGFSQAEALQKALVDLGQPHVISAGMTGVYTMPTLFRNTVLVGLLLSLGITTFQSSAQVDATNRLPIQPCLEKKLVKFTINNLVVECEEKTTFFMSIDDLKADLIPKGVKFGQGEIVYVTGKKELVPEITFPQGKPILVVTTGNRLAGDAKFEYSNKFVHLPTFLMDSLPKSGLPVTLTGWEKPIVSVGDTQFDISLSQTKLDPKAFYGSLVIFPIVKLFQKQARGGGTMNYEDGFDIKFAPSFPMYKKIISTSAEINKNYIIITLEQSSDVSFMWRKDRESIVVKSQVLHLEEKNLI